MTVSVRRVNGVPAGSVLWGLCQRNSVCIQATAHIWRMGRDRSFQHMRHVPAHGSASAPESSIAVGWVTVISGLHI
eukprot:1336166-Prymnesium_polylepis.1